MRYTLEHANEIQAQDIAARTAVQFMKGLMLEGSWFKAVQWLERELGPHHPQAQLYVKTAALGLPPTSDRVSWATLAEAFARLLRQRTILGSLPGTLPATVGTWTPFVNQPVTGSWGIPFPAMGLSMTAEQSLATTFGVIIPFLIEFLKQSGDAGLTVIERIATLILREAENVFVLDRRLRARSGRRGS